MRKLTPDRQTVPRRTWALLLLAGLSACEAPSWESKEHSPSASIEAPPASSAPPDIDSADAEQIASGFVRAQVISGNRPEWSDAYINDVIAYFDAEGRIQAYEAAVVSEEKEPRGWVMVEAWDIFDPVSTYVTEGSTNLDQLIDRFEMSEGRSLSAEDVLTPLWVGPSSAGLEVESEDGSVVQVSLAPEVDTIIYDGDVRFELASDPSPDPEDTLPEDAQRSQLRDIYRSQDYSDDLMGGRRMSITGEPTIHNVAVGSGASSFSNFIQENRPWKNDAAGIYTCSTGCTPVAFGILIEYWDRNGYPSLVSTSTDNKNTSSSDSDVQWMLDELRWNLQTSCVSLNGAAGTSSTYYTKAVDHINSRKAGTWTSDNTDASTKWSRFTGQIDAGRPAIVHYDVDHTGGTIDHSATGYEYTDNSGSTNDWICAEKGWYATDTTWDCFTRTSVGNYHVTRVMPP